MQNRIVFPGLRAASGQATNSPCGWPSAMGLELCCPCVPPAWATILSPLCLVHGDCGLSQGMMLGHAAAPPSLLWLSGHHGTQHGQSRRSSGGLWVGGQACLCPQLCELQPEQVCSIPISTSTWLLLHPCLSSLLLSFAGLPLLPEQPCHCFPSPPHPLQLLDRTAAHHAPHLLLGPSLGVFHPQCPSTGRGVLADSRVMCLPPGHQTQDQALTTILWTGAKPVIVIWPQPNLAFAPVVAWKLPVAAGNWDPVSLVEMLRQLKGHVMQPQ